VLAWSSSSFLARHLSSASAVSSSSFSSSIFSAQWPVIAVFLRGESMEYNDGEGEASVCLWGLDSVVSLWRLVCGVAAVLRVGYRMTATLLVWFSATY
jgi:hypothetical protein